jgi:hypothetical protein
MEWRKKRASLPSFPANWWFSAGDRRCRGGVGGANVEIVYAGRGRKVVRADGLRLRLE